MPVKKHSVEKIIAKLREIEKLTAHVDAHGGEEGGGHRSDLLSLLSLADPVRCAQGGGQTTAAARRS